MPVQTIWYGNGLRRVASGDIDWVVDEIRLALCTSTYVPSQDSHQTWADITNEATGSVYVAKGKALTGQTISYDAATNRVWLNADDVVWGAETITARYGIIHKYNATDASDFLLAWVDFGEDKSSIAEDFQVKWAANDALYIQATAPS